MTGDEDGWPARAGRTRQTGCRAKHMPSRCDSVMIRSSFLGLTHPGFNMALLRNSSYARLHHRRHARSSNFSSWSSYSNRGASRNSYPYLNRATTTEPIFDHDFSKVLPFFDCRRGLGTPADLNTDAEYEYRDAEYEHKHGSAEHVHRFTEYDIRRRRCVW